MKPVCLIECDLCECQGIATFFYPWDQMDEMEGWGWVFLTDDGRIESALCPHCSNINPKNYHTV